MVNEELTDYGEAVLLASARGNTVPQSDHDTIQYIAIHVARI